MVVMGDVVYEGVYWEIVCCYEEMVQGVIFVGEIQILLYYQVNELFDELKDIFQGIYLIKDFFLKMFDIIVSYGECLFLLIVLRLI